MLSPMHDLAATEGSDDELMRRRSKCHLTLAQASGLNFGRRNASISVGGRTADPRNRPDD
jgi:hypothetical protein